MDFFYNSSSLRTIPICADDEIEFGISAPDRVRSYLASCPRHAPTPLLSLRALAASLDCGAVLVKDEGQRFGLGSFKALGGAYAVIRIVAERVQALLGQPMDPDALTSDAVTRIARTITVCCATDGNHGRSVAAGAALMKCRAIIFLHEGVTEQRVNAIRALGAETVRVRGHYDDSVAEAKHRAAELGWHLVSDTTQDEKDSTPRIVMQGYTVLVAEALEQMAALEIEPTHVFLQAGVGGLAAAASAYLRARLGRSRPKIVVVEPDRAQCILESAKMGRPVRVPPTERTVMSMMECYEPSHPALRILMHCADAFISVPDEVAVLAMRSLAIPISDDQPIVCGESGAAGLAGLLALNANAEWRQEIQLDSRSNVLLINTETATDPILYTRLVGLTPGQVLASRGQLRTPDPFVNGKPGMCPAPH